MSEETNVNELLEGAHSMGILSTESMQTLSLVDIGAQIQGALGIPALDVQASEALLVSLLIDDSSSISSGDNTQHMIDGQNMIIDQVLGGSRQRNDVLMYTRYLNGQELHQYCPLHEAVRMDSTNYNPRLGTPLYDQYVAFLKIVLAKVQELANAGLPVRTISMIVTDGCDLHSRAIRTPSLCAPVTRDMLAQEDHIITAMGVDDGSTPFRQIFQEMGLEDRCIFTPGNTAHEIRDVFGLWSRSSSQASKGAGEFSKVALGGFTT